MKIFPSTVYDFNKSRNLEEFQYIKSREASLSSTPRSSHSVADKPQGLEIPLYKQLSGPTIKNCCYINLLTVQNRSMIGSLEVVQAPLDLEASEGSMMVWGYISAKDPS